MPVYKKTILLTGAGFSKNFGGFLSKEMWAKIFNNPKLKSILSIKEKLRTDFDFESVYAEVLQGGNFTKEDKNTFQEIIIDAYNDMDDMLAQYVFNGDDPYQVNFYGVSKLLGLFTGSGSEVGLHFTLNQDLFLERKLNRFALGLGLSKYQEYRKAIQEQRISSDLRIELPDKKFIEEFKQKHIDSVGDLFYIKLHGSLGWFSNTGSSQMVLGNNKLADIMNEPLLNWYFEIFEEVIYRNEVKLFIFGYGFRDAHINERITKAVREHGLKIYIISPIDPEALKNQLIGKPSNLSQIWEQNEDGNVIWNGIDGFFPYSMREVFPSNQSETDKKKDLFKAIEE